MNAATAVSIYTLGHSRHSIDAFILLLKQHRIERVVDVRGQPYSRHNPQFNREPFSRCLAAGDIDYAWSGAHLSGRPGEARFYGPGGEVLWDKLMKNPQLHAALDSLAEDAQACRIALVCAEEDPICCHRRFLLTPPLTARGLAVLHLRGDGRVQPESELLARQGAAGVSRQRDLFS